MAESQQHKLDRVRPPRVQITYDVEDGGKMVKKELPFVVGVLADLSGQRKTPLPALKDPSRKFVEIDRDNINDVMRDAAPALNLSVANKLSDDGSKMRVALEFKGMQDFHPAKVAEQVAPLKELLEMRQKLDEVLARISTKPQLEDLLQDVLNNQAKVEALAKQMGIDAAAEAPKGEQ